MKRRGAGGGQVQVHPGRLRVVRPRDLAVRFAFGAGVSAIAGAISQSAGPTAGGVFLAFPGILLASLTLVAREEGLHTARDDARGAAFGAIGMIAFAVVCWTLAERVNGWLVLGLAALAWLLISIAAYRLVQRLASMHREKRGRHDRGRRQPRWRRRS